MNIYLVDRMNLTDIGTAVHKNAAETKALAERLDYLTVAVMRGDPRFAKAEHAKPEFDAEAFDKWWASKGKRIPTIQEVFG